MENIIGLIIKDTVLGGLLALVLYWVAQRLLKAIDQRYEELRDLFVEIKRESRRAAERQYAVMRLIGMHDMTVSGINPTTDARSDDPDVIRHIYAKWAEYIKTVEDLKHDLEE